MGKKGQSHIVTFTPNASSQIAKATIVKMVAFADYSEE